MKPIEYLEHTTRLLNSSSRSSSSRSSCWKQRDALYLNTGTDSADRIEWNRWIQCSRLQCTVTYVVALAVAYHRIVPRFAFKVRLAFGGLAFTALFVHIYGFVWVAPTHHLVHRFRSPVWARLEIDTPNQITRYTLAKQKVRHTHTYWMQTAQELILKFIL